jgi:hypothetical protein
MQSCRQAACSSAVASVDFSPCASSLKGARVSPLLVGSSSRVASFSKLGWLRRGEVSSWGLYSKPESSLSDAEQLGGRGSALRRRRRTGDSIGGKDGAEGAGWGS